MVARGYFTYTRYLSSNKTTDLPDGLLFGTHKPLTSVEVNEMKENHLLRNLLSNRLIVLDWMRDSGERCYLFTTNPMYVPPFEDAYGGYGLTIWEGTQRHHWEYVDLLEACKEPYRTNSTPCMGCPLRGRHCVTEKFARSPTIPIKEFLWPFISAVSNPDAATKGLNLGKDLVVLNIYQRMYQFVKSDSYFDIHRKLVGAFVEGFWFVDPRDTEPTSLLDISIKPLRPPKYHSFVHLLDKQIHQKNSETPQAFNEYYYGGDFNVMGFD